jgi:hypothetical protein
VIAVTKSSKGYQGKLDSSFHMGLSEFQRKQGKEIGIEEWRACFSDMFW